MTFDDILIMKIIFFLGSNAVDVLHSFSKNNSELFPSSYGQIGRGNIVRLCQVFLDQGILEPAKNYHDANKSIRFKDSTMTYYQFTEHTLVELKSSQNRGTIQDCNSRMHSGKSGFSSEKKRKVTPKHSFTSLVPRNKKSRSRFPTFTNPTSAQAVKESMIMGSSLLMTSYSHTITSSESEEEKISSTLSRSVMRRSSSCVDSRKKRSSSVDSFIRTPSTSSSDSVRLFTVV